jgi:hypothetical protein
MNSDPELNEDILRLTWEMDLEDKHDPWIDEILTLVGQRQHKDVTQSTSSGPNGILRRFITHHWQVSRDKSGLVLQTSSRQETAIENLLPALPEAERKNNGDGSKNVTRKGHRNILTPGSQVSQRR